MFLHIVDYNLFGNFVKVEIDWTIIDFIQMFEYLFETSSASFIEIIFH